MSVLIKHSVILHQRSRPNPSSGVLYGRISPEVESYRMPIEVWEEMKRPETITLTVEIGDTLND